MNDPLALWHELSDHDKQVVDAIARNAIHAVHQRSRGLALGDNRAETAAHELIMTALNYEFSLQPQVNAPSTETTQ